MITERQVRSVLLDGAWWQRTQLGYSETRAIYVHDMDRRHLAQRVDNIKAEYSRSVSFFRKKRSPNRRSMLCQIRNAIGYRQSRREVDRVDDHRRPGCLREVEVVHQVACLRQCITLIKTRQIKYRFSDYGIRTKLPFLLRNVALLSIGRDHQQRRTRP